MGVMPSTTFYIAASFWLFGAVWMLATGEASMTLLYLGGAAGWFVAASNQRELERR